MFPHPRLGSENALSLCLPMVCLGVQVPLTFEKSDEQDGLSAWKTRHERHVHVKISRYPVSNKATLSENSAHPLLFSLWGRPLPQRNPGGLKHTLIIEFSAAI